MQEQNKKYKIQVSKKVYHIKIFYEAFHATASVSTFRYHSFPFKENTSGSKTVQF